jgi:hypothetical protein
MADNIFSQLKTEYLKPEDLGIVQLLRRIGR